MEIGDIALRRKIRDVVGSQLKPMVGVLAGWECGSIAFNLEDEYSDIDLNFLLDDSCTVDSVYTAVESALETVSQIEMSHSDPPGRYFKLREGSDFLLVDVCIYQARDLPERLDTKRHGTIIPLFDKGTWLESDPSSSLLQVDNIVIRLKEHQEWFSVSQSFVRKAIFRGRQIEGLAAYWAYTLKPLVELLRIQYCPHRWDFGMRYLERDLPSPVYKDLCSLMFVGDSDDLAEHLMKATIWAEQLLRDIEETAEFAREAS